MAVTLTCYAIPFFFFFFQAEDGIRDLTVTGVQTCALPISEPCHLVSDAQLAEQLYPALLPRAERFFNLGPLGFGCEPPRSEERRVGKECRARWWRDQYEKKATGRQVGG